MKAAACILTAMEKDGASKLRLFHRRQHVNRTALNFQLFEALRWWIDVLRWRCRCGLRGTRFPQFFSGLLWVPQELLGANPARHRVDNMRGKKCWRQCAGLVGVTRRFRCLPSWWWTMSLSPHLSTVFAHVQRFRSPCYVHTI